MLDYELCKQLKDAGFQQETGGGKSFFYYRKNRFDPQKFDRTQYDTCCVLGMEENDDVYEPSLSELIEACGEGFTSLYRFDDDIKPEKVVDGKRWVAGCIYPFTWWTDRYTSPEEAVARLWLKLNGKNA